MAPPNSPPSSIPIIMNSNGGDEYTKVNWDEVGFNLTPTDFMYVMKCSNKEGVFLHGHLIPYGNIQMSPASGVLNYGQGLFEGLKAYRREDGGIQLFRAEMNALRMKLGAERLCMPSPSVDQFIHAVKVTVLANKRWGRTAMNLYVEDRLHRAIPGGTGAVKSITNYSPVFLAQKEAKAKGFTDVLFLDSVNGKYVEEVAACNIFIVKDNVIATPAITDGTILPGVTRKSIIELATKFGYEGLEQDIYLIENLMSGVIVNPIGTLTYQSNRIEYRTGKEALSQKLYETLAGIQTGLVEDNMGWTIQLN